MKTIKQEIKTFYALNTLRVRVKIISNAEHINFYLISFFTNFTNSSTTKHELL